MQISDALDVVREQHHCVLSVLKSDGSPQMSPVDVIVDAEDRLVISSRETAYKIKSLRRDPRVWLCILPDAFYGRWIQVAGDAEIVSLPEAMDGLVDYYRRAAGEHEDWDDYRAAMQRDQRCLIRVTPTAAGPDRQG